MIVIGVGALGTCVPVRCCAPHGLYASRRVGVQLRRLTFGCVCECVPVLSPVSLVRAARGGDPSRRVALARCALAWILVAAVCVRLVCMLVWLDCCVRVFDT